MKQINKHIVITSLSLLFTLLCIFLLSACNPKENAEKVQLNAPTNLIITDEVLEWDAVKDASGYVVEIDGKEYETQTNGLDIFLITNRPKTYTIKVMACTDDTTYKDSTWSQPIEHEIEMPMGLGLKPINNNTEYSVTVTDVNTIKGKIIIPSSSPDGKPITEISPEAFNSCEDMTGIIVFDNIKVIGSNAFYGCTALKRVRLPQNLEEIKISTFYGCESLRQIDIPANVMTVGNLAFYNCSSLESITLSANVENLGTSVFSKCNSLTSITVDERNYVFRSDSNCIIRKSDNALVTGCKSSIIPDYVTKIEMNAFRDIELTSVTIPASVIEIGNCAFENCYALKNVTIENGVKRLGTIAEGNVFRNCKTLKNIALPKSLEEISGGTFALCGNLTDLTVAEDNPVYKSEGNCIIRKNDNQLVVGCVGSEIPDYVQSIGEYSFCECPLKTITIPASVTKINEQAFYQSRLESLVLSDGLEEIGVAAFEETKQLKDVSIPQSVTKVSAYAFYNSSLNSVIIPSSVSTIESGAFTNCTIFTSATLSNYPEGWYRGKSDGFMPSSPDWAKECTIFWGCELTYEKGIPYVESYTYVPSSRSPDAHASTLSNEHLRSYYSMPQRQNYTFCGFATDKDGKNIVCGISYYEPSDGTSPYYDFSRSDIESLASGTFLYSVWVPKT